MSAEFQNRYPSDANPGAVPPGAVPVEPVAPVAPEVKAGLDDAAGNPCVLVSDMTDDTETRCPSTATSART